jgi:hypothetical protein
VLYYTPPPPSPVPVPFFHNYLSSESNNRYSFYFYLSPGAAGYVLYVYIYLSLSPLDNAGYDILLSISTITPAPHPFLASQERRGLGGLGGLGGLLGAPNQRTPPPDTVYMFVFGIFPSSRSVAAAALLSPKYPIHVRSQRDAPRLRHAVVHPEAGDAAKGRIHDVYAPADRCQEARGDVGDDDLEGPLRRDGDGRAGGDEVQGEDFRTHIPGYGAEGEGEGDCEEVD